MLHYSFSTVLTAVFTSNLVILLIAFCFRHRRLLLATGYQLPIVFLTLTLLRLLFPFELPFAKPVASPAFVARFFSSIHHPLTSYAGFPISLCTILEAVWALGILGFAVRYAYRNLVFSRYVRMYGRDVTAQETYCAHLAGLCKQADNPFRILLVPRFTSPALYGIRSPRILLPAEAELTDDDLHYILKHEIAHHRHRDLWFKQVVNLLCIVYWWNPACFFLRRQLDLLLEMRVDDEIIRENPAARKVYLEALIHIMDQAIQIVSAEAELTAMFLSVGKEVLVPRFEMMCGGKDRHSLPFATALCVVVASLYLGSYCFTLENTPLPEDAYSFSCPARQNAR